VFRVRHSVSKMRTGMECNQLPPRLALLEWGGELRVKRADMRNKHVEHD
jgi:hypothetical protein